MKQLELPYTEKEYAFSVEPLTDADMARIDQEAKEVWETMRHYKPLSVHKPRKRQIPARGLDTLL